MEAITEIYLCDQTGVRIECLDYVTDYEYVKVANEPGPFRLKLPSKFDRKNIRLDNIVEIWRGFGPGILKLDYCGFLRDWEFGDDGGYYYTQLYGYSPMYLLTGRIVKNYSGSAQAKISDYADDMLKTIVIDQMGADAAADRDLTSVGGGFSVQSELSDGKVVYKSFALRDMLDVFEEICDTSAQLSGGVEVYYDIVPIISSSTTGALAFQFQTFTDQRGNDRTQDSKTPVFVGPEWGNLQNGIYGEYHSDETNYIYDIGPGEGESQYITEVSDDTRIGSSIWNRREKLCNANTNGFGYGLDPNYFIYEAYAQLAKRKPKHRLSGDVIQTPAFLYGRDWGFGDRITATYAGFQTDAMIDKVRVSRNDKGEESITAKLAVSI